MFLIVFLNWCYNHIDFLQIHVFKIHLQFEQKGFFCQSTKVAGKGIAFTCRPPIFRLESSLWGGKISPSRVRKGSRNWPMEVSYAKEHIEGECANHTHIYLLLRILMQIQHILSYYPKSTVPTLDYCKVRSRAQVVGMCTHAPFKVWHQFCTTYA